MKGPLFLRLNEVIEIHTDQIARYGGSGGIRDIDLLKSAIAMPAATFGGKYLHSDLYEMAAAYFFHLVKNHAFIDGNKRVATVAALVFLELNGVEVDADVPEFDQLVLDVIENKRSKNHIAEFLLRNSK